MRVAENPARGVQQGLDEFDLVTTQVASQIKFEMNTPDSHKAFLDAWNKQPPIIPAEAAFKLYDTYGFPIDLTRIMAEERGMTVDLAGYEKLMEQAKELSRGVDKAAGNPVYDLPPNILDELQKLNVHPTDDAHKFHRAPARATLRAIWNGHDLDETADASSVRAGEQVAVILDKTNFYAEMGGQVGDTGEMRSDSGTGGTSKTPIFIVDTARGVGHFVLHIGHIKSGKITVGDGITAYVMGGRDRTEKNHTSTHLANWALRETLGDHVQQKGSLVDPEKLRFDFVHQKALTDEEIAAVQTLVNGCITQKLPVYSEIAPQEQALKIHGLRAVFGEKYPPMVRVVSIGVPIPELIGNLANQMETILHRILRRHAPAQFRRRRILPHHRRGIRQQRHPPPRRPHRHSGQTCGHSGAGAGETAGGI